MNKFGACLVAACVTMAIAATPALAQQGGQGGVWASGHDGPGRSRPGHDGQSQLPEWAA